MLTFDTIGFLKDHFLDADGVIGLVSKHAPEVPNREAVRKWFARGAVPGEWWPILQCALERENGVPISLATYLGGGDDNDIFA